VSSDDDGWVPVAEAARRLGLSPSYVAAGRRTSRFPVVRRGKSDWLRIEDLESLAQEREHQRSTYLSYEQAAKMAGCSHVAIERAVAKGEIAQRAVKRHRGQSSLKAESVREWAEDWNRRQELRAAAAQERAERVARRQRLNQEPDDEHVWVDAATAALMVGVTPGGLRTMASADRVPHVRVGRRFWFRRDLLEQWMAARVAAPRFRTGL
jgi:hypothetical protein